MCSLTQVVFFWEGHIILAKQAKGHCLLTEQILFSHPVKTKRISIYEQIKYIRQVIH